MTEPVAPPAMDEILASIRRIIAEDPPLAAGSAVPRGGLPAPAEDEVLELGAAERVSPPPPRAAADPLLSAQAEGASRSALAALGELRIDPDAPDHTMDGLVRELVRPLLKQWLDANLPEIVERLVAREVARLGGR